MSPEVLGALVMFGIVTSVTPGPNNLMLMASGANFGFWRTVPHMLGIGIGFTAMIVVVGMGLAEAFVRWPQLNIGLKFVGVVYMLWLAWKIANASQPKGRASSGRPMTFVQAAAFQWVNPKAWAMSLTAVTVYAATGGWAAVMWVALVFGAINFPCVSVWTVMGQQMRRWLTNPMRLRVFNWTMAALLIASLYPVFLV